MVILSTTVIGILMPGSSAEGNEAEEWVGLYLVSCLF
jgi:hypothetical protein